MDKKISFAWSLGVGLIFFVLSLVIFISGFGNSGTQAPLMSYVMVFLSGTLIGAVLVYFLRLSEQAALFKVTLISFGVSIPFAIFGLVFGGVVGGIGLFLLVVSPSVFITGLGHYLGRIFIRK